VGGDGGQVGGLREEHSPPRDAVRRQQDQAVSADEPAETDAEEADPALTGSSKPVGAGGRARVAPAGRAPSALPRPLRLNLDRPASALLDDLRDDTI